MIISTNMIYSSSTTINININSRRVGECLELLCIININSSCADVSRMFAVSIVGAV